MDTLLIVGTVLGAVCGALHAHAIHGARRRDGADSGMALYYAGWTFALWTLFGGYLLILWLAGAAGMGLARLWKPAS